MKDEHVTKSLTQAEPAGNSPDPFDLESRNSRAPAKSTERSTRPLGFAERLEDERDLREARKAVEAWHLRLKCEEAQLQQKQVDTGLDLQRQMEADIEREAERKRARLRRRVPRRQKPLVDHSVIVRDPGPKVLGDEVQIITAVAELPYSTLTKTPQEKTYTWEGDDKRFLIVRPAKDRGRPSAYDKRIVVYALSIIAHAIRNNLPISRWVEIVPGYYLAWLKEARTGTAYAALHEGILRIVESPVETNVRARKTWRKRVRAGGLFSEADFDAEDLEEWMRNDNREKPVLVQLSKWVWEFVMRGMFLVLDRDYLSLRPFDQRVYEVARFHLRDKDSTTPISRGKLRAKLGCEAKSTDPTKERSADRRFGDELTRLEKRHKGGLLGYAISHTKAHVVMKKASPPKKKTTQETHAPK